jgi:HD-GYP domain-containing protein (c-di-GMP phosphodiesterase class II)
VTHTVLLAGGIWALLALITYLLLLPLLRIAKRSDELEPGAAGPKPRLRRLRLLSRAARPPVAPVEAGYAGLVLQRLMLHTATLLGADEACLLVKDVNPPHRLLAVAEHGLGEEAIGEPPPPGHRGASMAMASGRPISIPDRPRSSRGPDRLGSASVRRGAAPVLWHGGVRGALSVASWSTERGSIGPGQLELLAELGGLAGQALEHHRRHGWENADTSTEVRLLLEALRRSDASTREHADDVVSLAQLVGRQLGLDSVSAYELEVAAALHDVGKIRVPAVILNAARPLAPSEWDLMHMHPVWSFEMVAAIPGLEAIAPLVRAHHERWDGHGYPDGLAGERIPLASRIIAACDALGALTSDRPYRSRSSLEAALSEIAGNAGSQFDRAIVVALNETLAAVGGREPALAS